MESNAVLSTSRTGEGSICNTRLSKAGSKRSLSCSIHMQRCSVPMRSLGSSRQPTCFCVPKWNCSIDRKSASFLMKMWIRKQPFHPYSTRLIYPDAIRILKGAYPAMLSNHSHNTTRWLPPSDNFNSLMCATLSTKKTLCATFKTKSGLLLSCSKYWGLHGLSRNMASLFQTPYHTCQWLVSGSLTLSRWIPHTIYGQACSGSRMSG